jgi:hypothetical protein
MYGNEAKEENKIPLASRKISFAFQSLVYFYIIRRFGKVMSYVIYLLHESFTVDGFLLNLVWISPTTHPCAEQKVMQWRKVVSLYAFRREVQKF